MEKDVKNINYNYIKQLYTILNDENEIYKSILDAEKEKNKLLMEGIFANLEPINSKMTSLVEKSINIEQKRITLCNMITRELGIPPTSSLKRLLISIPEDYTDKLSGIYIELTGNLAEIKRLNDINTRLISDTLRIIDVTLDAYMNENSSVEINYGNQIKGKNTGNNNINSPKLFSKRI